MTPKTVCSDTPIEITFATTTTGADRYDVLATQSANVIGTPTTGTMQSNTIIFSDAFTNTSSTTGDVVYRVTPHSFMSSGNCVGDPFDITVTIQPEPVMDLGLLTKTVCSDTDIEIVLATNGTSIVADRYDVLATQSANVIGTPTTGALLDNMAIFSDQFTNTSSASGNIVYSITPHSALSSGGCLGDSFDITVTIDPEPVMSRTLLTKAVCSGTDVEIAFDTEASSIGADRYDVVASSDTYVMGTPTTGSLLGGMAIFGDQFINTSNASGNVVYTVTPHSASSDGDCTGDSFDITVTIQPQPVIEPTLSPKTVCSDTDIEITLTTAATSTGADRYDVAVASQSSNLIGMPTIGPLSTNTIIFRDQFTNTSTVSGDVVYTVTPYSTSLNGNCMGDAFDITVTIDP